MSKEYKVISNKYVEHLIDELATHGSDDWGIVAYFQEFGTTKILLQREVNEKEGTKKND